MIRKELSRDKHYGIQLHFKVGEWFRTSSISRLGTKLTRDTMRPRALENYFWNLEAGLEKAPDIE
jgi:hypothetical protein